MSSLKHQLRSIKDAESRCNPDAVWVLKNKTALLARVNASRAFKENNISASEQTFGFVSRLWEAMAINRLALALRPALTVVLVLTLTTTGWMTSASAANSLPGDLLYSVKRAAEGIQVAVTPTKQGKATVHLEQASRRSQEVVKIIEKKQPEGEKLAKQTLEDLKKSITSAKENVKGVDPDQKVVAATALVQATEEIKQTLQEVEGAEDVAVGVGKDINKTTTQTDDAAIEVVENLVATQAENSDIVKTEDVQKVVSNVAETILKDIQKDNTKVQAIAEQVQKALSDGEKPVVVSSQTVKENMATSTKSTIDLITPFVETTTGTIQVSEMFVKEVVKKADETTEKAAQLKGLVEQTVQNKQLSEVIQTVRELAEAKQAVSEAKQVVADALPVSEKTPASGAPLPSTAPLGTPTSTVLTGQSTTTVR